MNKSLSIVTLVIVMLFSVIAIAADKVVVIPLFDTPKGDAVALDVLNSKTFSSSNGTGLIGTRAPAPLSRTGRKTIVLGFDDGQLQSGVMWPNPRFTDNEDGTVTDNLTGLMWLWNADCAGTVHPEYDTSQPQDGRMPLDDALGFINLLNNFTAVHCQVNPPNKYQDWRMPNIREMESLISYEYYNPALPNTSGAGQWTTENPFNRVSSENYWTSTFVAWSTDNAWYLDIGTGFVGQTSKTTSLLFWPVRGGY